MSLKRISMAEAVKGPYPGRGIAVGESADGKKAVFAYFIMGRSANSRNRVFCRYGEEVRTEPFDVSKVEDPSLIIYSPVKRVKDHVIVTNGDQTDTIEQSILAGHCFRHALMQRTFEPDAPNYTPRISAILHLGNTFSYEMSILKHGGKGSCERQFFSYEPVAGYGYFLHTYASGRGRGRASSALPSFRGTPTRVRIPNFAQELAGEIWSHLDEDNKISLYCCAISLETGETEHVLFNKYER